MSNTSPKKRTPVIVALSAIIVICLAGAITGGVYVLNANKQIADAENAANITPSTPEPTL